MNESPQGMRTIINRCCKRRSKSMKPYIGMMKQLLHSYRLQTSSGHILFLPITVEICDPRRTSKY